jgi:hypothetical protein
MNGAGKDRRPVPDGHGMGLGDLAPARGVSDGDMAQVACMEWTDLSQTSSRSPEAVRLSVPISSLGQAPAFAYGPNAPNFML